MESIILIGAGGHCRSCIDVIEREGRFQIAGLVERVDVKNDHQILGYSLLGNDDNLPFLRQAYDYALVTVGQIHTPCTRISLYERLVQLGFELPVIISPFAYVSRHAHIESGTIIMHHAMVNAGAKVGKNCILNTKALAEHDVQIHSHCHLAPGAILSGGAELGPGSFVGCNAMTRENIKIGAGSLIGGGVCVMHDLPISSRI
jgi:sugar O-acyltransferase (sialic acid O-acetyltransferase NeuD family)